MSFFVALDRSASSIARRIKTRPLLTNSYPGLNNRPATAAHRQPSSDVTPEFMNNDFFYAFLKAGACLVSQRQISCKASSIRYFPSHGIRAELSRAHVRKWSSSTRFRSSIQPVVMQASREDFKDLVDYYNNPLDGKAGLHSYSPRNFLPACSNTSSTLEHERFDSLPLSNGESSRHTYSEEDCPISRLNAALTNYSMSNDALFDMYKSLPLPFIKTIPAKRIRLLLHRFAVVEKKSERGMLQYLSIIDDMKEAGVELTPGEWSSAIAFVGRCYSKVTAAEVRSALYIWKEMEADAGVSGTNVTFNILFDIAVKAGKYGLAEMILKEMQSRRLEFNRFTHVGMIFYYGLRGDGENIRKTYRELVDSGEIVDTVVLNCVIASLIRAGEAGAAEQVFGRMMKLHAKQIGTRLLPPRDWRTSRKLGRVLARASLFYRDKPEARKGIQASSPVAPDLRTFRILLSYHAQETGDVDKLSYFLDEMRVLEIPIHGRIFLLLFQGFAIQGTARYSSWTKPLLETVWSAFQQALQDRPDDVFWGKWMAVWIVRAFHTCGGQEPALEIWQEIQSLWQPGSEEVNAIHKMLRSILTQPDSASQ